MEPNEEQEPQDYLAAELIEGEASPDFDRAVWKFRCISCKRIMTGSLAQVKKIIKLYRKQEFLTIRSQIHLRLPFLYDITVTLWNREKPRQSKHFLR